MQAIGLRTHIWNNNFKSILLLVVFPLLVLGVVYAFLLIMEGAGGADVGTGLVAAGGNLAIAAPIAFAGTGAWFGVAYFSHQAMIDMAVGAHGVERNDEGKLYNLLENLCISRGMATPRLHIIETPARNAFASGLSEGAYTITVTRGLVDDLSTDELEAVLAHELTHIINRDVRLLVIAAVFVGVIAFAGEMTFRGMVRGHMPRTSRHRRGGGVNAGALILIAFAILAVAYGIAIVLRFALSRRREYMADAGSVELTKNPDAMITALRKVAGQSEVRAPSDVQEMFLENRRQGFAGLFATHPPIEKRIEALQAFGGAIVG